MERLDVKIGWFYYLLMAVFGLLSAGLLPIAFWFSTRSWPRTLERDHLTLRNGTRIPWSECTNVVKMGWGRWDLVFGATTVAVPTISIRRGKQVMEWIHRRLGTAS